MPYYYGTVAGGHLDLVSPTHRDVRIFAYDQKKTVPTPLLCLHAAMKNQAGRPMGPQLSCLSCSYDLDWPDLA